MSDLSSTWDPGRKLLTDLRDDAAVAAIAGANPSEPVVARVRLQEEDPDDVQPAKSWRAYIVLVSLGGAPHPQVPVQRPRHAVRCYGRTREEAEALAAASFKVLHGAGPRQQASGNAIYVSHDVTGPSYTPDPVTKQPCYVFVVESLATTQVVAP